MQISIDGGYNAHWSHDGRELFFQMERNVYSTAVTFDGQWRSGKPGARGEILDTGFE